MPGVKEVLEVDGRALYLAFIAGARNLIENERHLNEINVFPVPDSDTGTNLKSTVKSIMSNLEKRKSFKNTTSIIASAALEGARGNSGMIFAQFFHGLNEETPDIQKISFDKFSQIIFKAIHYPFNAVESPVDGTILTVMRDWAEALIGQNNKVIDFKHGLHVALMEAKKSLSATMHKMEILKKNKVVDAGAQGFVYFLDGISAFLEKGRIALSHKEHAEPASAEEHKNFDEKVKYRYCTEAIIEGEGLDIKFIRSILPEYGDSIVVAGGKNKVRVHIHTDCPSELMLKLKKSGNLPFQKVEDIYIQYADVNAPKSKTAIVTDSACDLPVKFMQENNVHLVPINLHIDGSVFLDRLSITPEVFIRFMNESKSYPTTSQPAVSYFKILYGWLLDHYDSIISIHISSKLSGTSNASKIAADEISKKTGKRINVIDSRQLSGALGLLVKEAVISANAGASHDAMVDKLIKMIPHSSIFVSVTNLKYMVKGGRVSPLKGFIAKVLNIKPIISIDKEGNSTLLDKTFSQSGNMRKIVKTVSRMSKNRKIKNYCVLHANNPEGAEKMVSMIIKVLSKEPDYIMNISPVIALNAGRGAVAISLLEDEE